jgi:hypothetical protein
MFRAHLVDRVERFIDQTPDLRDYVPFWMELDISYATVL